MRNDSVAFIILKLGTTNKPKKRVCRETTWDLSVSGFSGFVPWRRRSFALWLKRSRYTAMLFTTGVAVLPFPAARIPYSMPLRTDDELPPVWFFWLDWLDISSGFSGPSSVFVLTIRNNVTYTYGPYPVDLISNPVDSFENNHAGYRTSVKWPQPSGMWEREYEPFPPGLRVGIPVFVTLPVYT